VRGLLSEKVRKEKLGTKARAKKRVALAMAD